MEPNNIPEVGFSGVITTKAKEVVVTVTDRKDPNNMIQIALSVEPVKTVSLRREWRCQWLVSQRLLRLLSEWSYAV